MRVLMLPHPAQVSPEKPSGIQAVVHAYAKHFPDHDIDLVTPDATSYDLVAVHAGVALPPPSGPFVAHCHGLYWSEHYAAQHWEHDGNAAVITNLRYAHAITVPSPWVAQNLARDLRQLPTVVPHGIDLADWPLPDRHEGPVFALWNKNRTTDACSPAAVSELARRRPGRLFMTTHLHETPSPNIEVIGTVPHATMRALVMASSVYLSTVKETFGIGILEAMAASKPILGWAYGGNVDLVQHGVNGYLATPGDYDDLAIGLDYCLTHQDVLGANSRYLARQYTWKHAVERVQLVYKQAIDRAQAPYDVTVVIPCYNKAATLARAVRSVLAQSLRPAALIIVDNNSSDDSYAVATGLLDEIRAAGITPHLERESRQGVAHARNRGLYAATTRYICCLDADDEILPDFLAVCVHTLRSQPALGLAYTKLEVIDEAGGKHYPDWPGAYDFDGFLERRNQVPTCCVFRRDLALRLGGYRQRYAPDGAGAEDAEFWLRMGALGHAGQLAADRPLFRYYLGGQVGGNPNYREADWLIWHPWAYDGRHPFASAATPANGLAHPVRQVDEPAVAVIIPCEPNHLPYLVDALDSLEGQSFRFWEAIVVFDTPIYGESVDSLRTAYPHVTFLHGDGRGAGAARNLGAGQTQAPYLLFLDADDWLEATCLEQMMAVAKAEPGYVVYSDYIGRAYGIQDPDALRRSGRLLHYRDGDQFAIIRYYAADYDCARAQRQPELGPDGEFYIWNLITSLVPRRLHEQIGGFDESMVSWEDWDYWLRMARAGICFIRIQEPLVSYRFYTGTRREIGRQRAADLLDYLRNKFEGEEPMACRGCGGRRRAAVPVAQMRAAERSNGQLMSSQDMVRVKLTESGFGRPITIRDHDTNLVHNYGFRRGGDTFLMLRKHAEQYPNRFEIIEAAKDIVVTPEPEPEPEPTPAPAPLEEEEAEAETATKSKPKTRTRRSGSKRGA